MANETLEQLGNALEAAQQKIGAVAEEVSEQAYNELVAIRREKLRGLQEAGNDPLILLLTTPKNIFLCENLNLSMS